MKLPGKLTYLACLALTTLPALGFSFVIATAHAFAKPMAFSSGPTTFLSSSLNTNTPPLHGSNCVCFINPYSSMFIDAQRECWKLLSGMIARWLFRSPLDSSSFLVVGEKAALECTFGNLEFMRAS